MAVAETAWFLVPIATELVLSKLYKVLETFLMEEAAIATKGLTIMVVAEVAVPRRLHNANALAAEEQVTARSAKGKGRIGKKPALTPEAQTRRK